MLDTYEESRLWWAGVCLLAATEVGPNLRRIKVATGAPIDIVNEVSYRMRQCGAWAGNHEKNYAVHYAWTDRAISALECEVAFVLDCLTAVGAITRLPYRRRTVGDTFPQYAGDDADAPAPSVFTDQRLKREQQRRRYIESARRRRRRN